MAREQPCPCSLATLADVVSFYDRGGNRNPSLDEEIRPIGLAATERDALLAFLLTLSGDLQDGIAEPRARPYSVVVVRDVPNLLANG